MSSVDVTKFSMPIGKAMFTPRSGRRLTPDLVPMELIHFILHAAVKAPSGGNHRPGRFLVVTDRARIEEFGKLLPRGVVAQAQGRQGLDEEVGHPRWDGKVAWA